MRGFGLKPLMQSFKRDGFLGLLNIFGLSIGITMGVLVVWYIQHNLSFDKHLIGSENIYRLVSKDINDGSLSFGSPLPMAEVIRNDYPEDGIVAGISLPRSYKITFNNSEFNLKASISDAEIFKILDFQLQAGSSESLLKEPNDAIITNSCAKKIFGSLDPIGKGFELESTGEEMHLFTVKGILKDYPSNSEFKPEVLLSWESMYPKNWRELWWWGGTSIFVKVVSADQKNNLELKINTILDRYDARFIKGRYEYQLLPLKDSHFRPDIGNAFTPAISLRLLWTLGIIALFIIGIACINFINLAFSQSKKYSKEAGIRKVSGASQNDLTIRFLTIPLQKAMIAILPAIVFITFLEEPFKILAQFNGTTPFNNPMIWVLIVGMILLTGLLSGFYPAVSLAKSNPIETLYNKQNKNTSMRFFRNMLTVIQLIIANILIIASFFIFKQITFMKNHDLGFNKEGLIALEVGALDNDTEKRIQKLKVFKQEIIKQSASSGIMGMCEAEAIPGFFSRNGFTVYEPKNWDTYTVTSIGIDENYSSIFEIPLTEGKNFGKDISAEKDAVLINETFKRQLNWNSIEGKHLTLFDKNYKIPVIGVLKDVHINSLNEVIPPIIYRYKCNAYPEYLIFRIEKGKEREVTPILENEWQKIAGDETFETFSINDRFNEMYGSEERFSKIIGIFSLIAILLSCFGILAYIANIIKRKTKEIGIRKVHGARTRQIINLFYMEILILLVLSSLIATPIAYYIMSKWIDNFAYRTTISWWIFVLSAILLFGITTITTILQTWKTARRSPVEALHYE